MDTYCINPLMQKLRKALEVDPQFKDKHLPRGKFTVYNLVNRNYAIGNENSIGSILEDMPETGNDWWRLKWEMKTELDYSGRIESILMN